MQKPRALTAEQLREFVTRGFLRLDSSLPCQYHEAVFDRAQQIVDGHGYFGNNLLPLIPGLRELFEDPVVKGALTSLLGNHYLLHPHRILETNSPGSDAEAFYRDSYWGYTRRVRNHRPWWITLIYYPQDTPVHLGPTSVMEGSQHLSQRPEHMCREIPTSGKAGRLLLAHHDIWHRRMKNLRDARRHLFKFEFVRLAPPPKTKPTKRAKSSAWRAPYERPALDLKPVWRRNWDWLHGQSNPPRAEGKLDSLLGDLDSVQEPVGINAGYLAAAHSKRAVAPLLEALGNNRAPNDNTKRYIEDGSRWQEDALLRNASHGLANIGREAVAGLVEALQTGNARARKYAAFALGENTGTLKVAHAALIEAVGDDDVHVRIAAVEALGLKTPNPDTLDAFCVGLGDWDAEVRFDAALALVRAAATAPGKLLEPLIEVLGGALYDNNRYVAAHAADALDRIGSKAALAILLPHLRTARWCPQTDNRRPF